jgi:uroporphyrinogen-III synthase
MRVLVTRAERAGLATAKRLRSLGFEPVLLPLAKPVHAPENALKALNQPHSALILTSAEAVEALSRVQHHLHPHFSTPVFAVGASTAKAAQSLGFQQVHAADGDGAALAQLLRAQHDPKALPLLYLAGHPRAKALERSLAEHDLPFHLCEVYRMETIAYQAKEIARHLGEQPVYAALLYSAETAKRFCALPLGSEISKVFGATRFLCLSQNVANQVIFPFNARVFVALHPDEESLFSLL